MRRAKNKKDELKLEEVEKPQPSKKVEPVISFDHYFMKMVAKNPKILPHHKAPMKQYAKKHGMLDGTVKDFEKLFSSY